MKEEADEPAVSETVEPPKVDEATVGEHPDVVATPNRLLHSACASSSSKHGS